MGIAPEPLLHLDRQAVHAAAHVGRPARDPDFHPGRKGDHVRSNAGSSRAGLSGSIMAGTMTRRPFTRTISIRS